MILPGINCDLPHMLYRGGKIERKLEDMDPQHCYPFIGRIVSGSFHTKQYGGVCGVKPAAFIAAGLALPGGVDHSLSADGHCCRTGGDIRCQRDIYRHCPYCLLPAACSQLFLADFFLQIGMALVFLLLAGVVVAADPVDHQAFL